MKKFLQYLYDIDSSALDWLWGLSVLYIPLSFVFGSFLGVLFALHFLLILSINIYHFRFFFPNLEE